MTGVRLRGTLDNQVEEVPVSGVFLVLIGLINLVALVGITRVFLNMRRGHFDEAALEKQLDSRGFLNRVLGRVTRAVGKPWHMYPVGFLFGLGFDTVTEIGLLVIAGGAVASGLPWWAVLTLPVLFTAGMALLDTIDGAFMNVAYGWAFAEITVLWLAVGATVWLFARISRPAAWLLVPYWLWVTFAAALNFTIWQLNKGVS